MSEEVVVYTKQIVLPMVWEDPPDDEKLINTPWAEIAEALKENPKRWAKLDVNIGYSSHITNGKLKDFRPSSDFETKQIRHKIYVRYVGSSD